MDMMWICNCRTCPSRMVSRSLKKHLNAFPIFSSLLIDSCALGGAPAILQVQRASIA